MNLNELTIKQASEKIRQKKISVKELVSDCLKVIKEKDKNLHCYLEIYEDTLEQAERADIEIAKYQNTEISNLPPLFGIPLAIKDNILIEGKLATAGSKILENYRASYDATVIKKLKKQGAIFLGKTNLDEFAMGSSTENSAFGPTKNPHDETRVPGGSSGGSAAAVAANLCLGALGSDTGGSIRQPASFCGVVGLKPTYGQVSRHGLIAMASSLDQIGPITKTVEDSEILLEAISGPDQLDATSVNPVRTDASHLADGSIKLPSANSVVTTNRSQWRSNGVNLLKSDFNRKNLNAIKIGLPKEYFGAGLNPEVAKVIQETIKNIEKSGAQIKEISLPHAQYALPAYYIIVPSEVSANLARFDGIRYGHHENSTQTLLETYTKSRAHGFGPEVKRRIMLGTYTLSAGYFDAYYLKAQKVRQLIRQDFEKALTMVDFILGPTTPTPAFKIGERSEDPLQMYLADIYTVAINLAGLPALSIPAGLDPTTQMPTGLQIIGGWFKEKEILNFSAQMEKIIAYGRPNR